MPLEYTVHCRQPIGRAPRLSQAVMGDYPYTLQLPGYRLHQTLANLADTPLLRRTMGTLNSGIALPGGPSYGTGVLQRLPDGSIEYDFALLDRIFDALVSPHCIPFVGLCFMPEELSVAAQATPGPATSGPELPPEAGEQRRIKLSEPWMKVDRTPPIDYNQWYDLIYAVVHHLVERFGAGVTAQWYWDFWNEPDLPFYWLGTREEYFKTYDYTVAAVRAALPNAKVGGCGVAHGNDPLFKAFLEHCTTGTNYYTGGQGAPLDFITFHIKGGPTGKLGRFSDPWAATDYVRRAPSLTHIVESVRATLQSIGSVPGVRGLPVFLTECDIDWGINTSIYQNPNMHYRNSEYYAVFQCALNKRMHDLRADFPDNPIEATFLDTFYVPGARIFEGQRTLITAGEIDKPILNALRLLAMLGQERLAADEPAGAPVEVLATAAGEGTVCVMAVNFAQEFDQGEPHEVRLRLEGLDAGVWRSRHYRIDRAHSNAYTAWLEMGRPLLPTDEQMQMLRARMGLELLEPEFAVDGAHAVLQTTMPPQSASLWVLERAR